MNTDYLVSMDGVEISYPIGRGERKVIFTDLGLRIRQGEFVTVVGPSGCGKSTLLRLILGSQFPYKGTVEVGGKQVERVDDERGIVYQRYSVFPNLTVLDNIAMGPLLKRTSIPGMLFTPWAFRQTRREIREEAMEYVTSVGLEEDDAKKYPYELSGGMRQRVAIAQALIMKQQILLMDEPFSALDAATREEMQLFVLELWEKYGMTIFFVTHEIEEAVFLGTRILGLSQHYSVSNGDPALGARIVVDKCVPGQHPRPVDWKYSGDAGAIVQRVMRDTMDKKHLQHVEKFDLDHRDAWCPDRGLINGGENSAVTTNS